MFTVLTRLFIILFLLMPSICFAEKTGILEVNSEPAGAKIFIDENYVGTTPYQNLETPIGKHEVKAFLNSDYPVQREKLSITEDDPIVHTFYFIGGDGGKFGGVEVEKEIKKYTGKIVFASIPSGATILLKGRQPVSTPKSFKDVDVGRYNIEFELNGKRLKGHFDIIKNKTIQLIADFNKNLIINKWEENKLKAQKEREESERLESKRKREEQKRLTAQRKREKIERLKREEQEKIEAERNRLLKIERLAEKRKEEEEKKNRLQIWQKYAEDITNKTFSAARSTRCLYLKNSNAAIGIGGKERLKKGIINILKRDGNTYSSNMFNTFKDCGAFLQKCTEGCGITIYYKNGDYKNFAVEETQYQYNWGHVAGRRENVIFSSNPPDDGIAPSELE